MRTGCRSGIHELLWANLFAKRAVQSMHFLRLHTAFANKFAPSVPGMGRNQPLESSGQTK
ncbi:hypothetical protein C6383_09940 [Pseudomonas syringae pv. actinidiae]|nr:hypothetical protein C6383_09940 [Pseudomonas syringae pv. actinidiae]